MELNAQLNFILLGKKGAGKSSSGNTILGRQAFTTKKCFSSVTEDQTMESGTVDEFPVTVYDTPGFFDPELSEREIQEKIEKVLQKSELGEWAFLIVMKADSFTEEERITVEKIEKLLGDKRFQKTWILFTRADELEDDNVTEQEFLNRNVGLEKLVQKYDQRYHMFNNKKKGPSEQVKMLLAKIIQPFVQKDSARLTRLIPGTKNTALGDSSVSSLFSRRIVLLGKTGAGKSAAGNTILGGKEFKSVLGSNSVTKKCLEKCITVSGRSVSVVDTPGFFDTKMKSEDLIVEIARSVYISSPGPHAFLIVLRVDDRFTEHEQQIPQQIEIVFGEGVLKYSIILFTHGDMLEDDPIEKLIEENCRLRSVVQQCGGRYHVFNNRDVNNREQVEDLLQKIDSMIQQNGGGHYTNQMYDDAQRFRQQEEERKKQEIQTQEEIERLRREIEKMRSECEDKQITQWEKQIQEEIESMINDKENALQSLEELKLKEFDLQSDLEFERFLKQNEKRFTYSAFTLGLSKGTVIGGLYGSVIGGIAGPVGVLVGGALGAAVGTVANLITGILDD